MDGEDVAAVSINREKADFPSRKISEDNLLDTRA
ncbi:DEKNAAC104151 [Brettanomyces naardenensis]|uniref:DEKNAAC104151 n=1 Tax=Brettanomyces naardenensis TaxID=13370 RepID=A0A448YQ15_BRENA|nr:DEKNAAC104151 [Brettanomyces naardenensis]